MINFRSMSLFFIFSLCCQLIKAEVDVQSIDKSLMTDFELDTVSANELMDCAAKFFKVVRITDEGWYSAQVCNGISGHLETNEVRNNELEGFCMSVIVKYYQDNTFNLYGEMTQAVKNIYLVKLGLNKEQRLYRAQGALYILMFNNSKLKEALLKEYQLQKEELNFVVPDWNVSN